MSGFISLPEFNPIMIDLPGPMAISWYGMMYLLGLLFAYLFVIYHIKQGKVSISSDQFTEILLRIFLGVIIGGRIGFCLFVNPSFYLKHPLRIFAVWEGGMFFFGGLILAMFLPFFYLRKTGYNYFDVADFIIIPAPVALAFGRLGNFINGEFWGRPSTAPWAMVFPTVPQDKWFPEGSEPVQLFLNSMGDSSPGGQELINLPRHPVQLYELLLEGVILYFILLLFRNIGPSKPRGSVLSLFLLSYGIFRFWIEFYREPASHSAIIAGDWFTLSMLFSIPMILLGAFGMWFACTKNSTNELYIREKVPAESRNKKNIRKRFRKKNS